MKRVVLPGVAAVIVIGLVWAAPRHRATAPRLRVEPTQLAADGYDTALVTIDRRSDAPPRVSVEPAHAATVEEVEATDLGYRARIRAGVMPAEVTVRVEFPGDPALRVPLTVTLAVNDSAGDGTPDFLRLDDAADRRAFRLWFAFLAEAQYFQALEQRPAEINDCAALIRYAYREALRAHDGAWATAAQLPILPGIPAVVKYQYPYTALGGNLFRVTPGPFRPADLGSFAQFADAKTLQLRNTYFVSRETNRAEPGDLLFFRQDQEHMPFHSMIYLGASQIEKSDARYLVYHTGPGEEGAGEIRRPTLDELRRFPDADWRPLVENPRFLGVYRWNILRPIS
ncbi:MAG: DUF1175 domain-containing protein [Candidatus Solibacter sp.]